MIARRPVLDAFCAVSTLIGMSGCALYSGGDPTPPDGCTQVSARVYRIDRVTVPSSATLAQSEGLDLDGDGTVDNEAGNVFASVLGVYPDLQTSLQASWDARFRGDTLWFVSLVKCDGGGARLSLSDSYTDGGFGAAGSWSDNRIQASGIGGAAPLGVLADLGGTGAVAWQGVSPLAVDLQVSADGTTLSGNIAGGFDPDYQTPIATAFVPYLQNRLDHGDTMWGASVDANHDGVITVPELLADSVFRTLMLPDLDNGDGQPTSMSFGLTVHATEL